MRLRRLLLHPYIRINMIILLLPGWFVRLISLDLPIMTTRPGMGTIGITITMLTIGPFLKEGMPDILAVVVLTMGAFVARMVDVVGLRPYMGGVDLRVAGM